MGIEALLLLFFNVLASTAITAVIYEYVVLYVDRPGEGIDVEDVWQQVKADFLRVLLTIVGQSVIIALVVVLFFLPGILFNQIGMIEIGTVLFAFPCIYLAVGFSLMVMIRIRERLSFFESLSRSFDLVKGEWWRTAGIILIMLVIMFTVSFVLYIPQSVVMALSSLHSVEGSPAEDAGTTAYRLPLILSAMLPQLGAFFLYSFPALAIGFQYFSLVEKKEGAGLLERIEEFGRASDTTDTYHEHY
jgi:hypothetical protein